MNYSREAVTVLLRGPLLHTPQGLACVTFSALAVLVGLVYFLVPPTIATWPLFRLGPVLFIWPIVLFVSFCWLGDGGEFKPSYIGTVLLSVVGLAPFVAPYVRNFVV